MNPETLYEAGFRATLRGTRLVMPTGFWRHPTNGKFYKGTGTIVSPLETIGIMESFFPELKDLPYKQMADEVRKLVLGLAHIHKAENTK